MLLVLLNRVLIMQRDRNANVINQTQNFLNFFKLLFPQYSFLLLYSMVTQLHIHVDILSSHIVMLHHE